MKKNLTIIVAALLVAAMAIPASASKLTLGGEYNAGWTYDAGEWNPTNLGDASSLDLELTFTEGESIVAYLPLTIEPFAFNPRVAPGNWYFSYATTPFSFWASNNNSRNAKKFAALGDPLGIGAKLPSTLVANAKGEIIGANFNLYAADLGEGTVSFGKPADEKAKGHEKVYWVAIPDKMTEGGWAKDKDGNLKVKAVKVGVPYELGNVWMGRATYGLPAEFTLGLVGAYTDGVQKVASFELSPNAKPFGTTIIKVIEKDANGKEIEVEYEVPVYNPAAIVASNGEAEFESANPDLTFGVDLAGKIPGIDAKLSIAGAGYWEKTDAWKFEGAEDNYAYQVKLSDIAVGQVEDAWMKYTAVGPNFVSRYADMKKGKLLFDYKGAAAAEAEVTVGIPLEIPVKLTLGDTLWMSYKADPKWNEATAKVVVTPLADLDVTVSGAYKADLDKDENTAYDGYNVHADVSYDVMNVNLNPYVDYLAKSYGKASDYGVDKVTVVGVDIDGKPVEGLKVGANASYMIEEPVTDLFGYGIYTTDLNPGFVKTANSQVAAVAAYEKEAEEEATTDFYGYAGTTLKITDAFDAKLGVLSKDTKGKAVASAALTYKASDSISTGLTYTFRQEGVARDEGAWAPFDDGGRNYLKASVTGTVGESTISIAYGVDGLKPADTRGFHADKPWAYLRNHPGAAMNWQLLTLSVKVPF